MSIVRLSLSIAVMGLLVVGYLASVFNVWQGTAAEYAAKVDTPPIRALALVLLVASIALAFIPDREADGH